MGRGPHGPGLALLVGVRPPSDTTGETFNPVTLRSKPAEQSIDSRVAHNIHRSPRWGGWSHCRQADKPRRPLCCSCSFGTPRPAPEFESRGERERLSALSLSHVRPRVPALHAPAPGRFGDATGLRSSAKQTRTAQLQQRPRARSLRHTTQQHSNRRKAAQCRRARWVGWGGGAGGGGVRVPPGTSSAVYLSYL